MAKYTIKAGCGHTVEQQLYGPGKERARRIAWQESPAGKCNACYAVAKREEEAARAEARIAQLVGELRAATQPIFTPELLASLRGQIAAAPEGDARAEAMRRYLEEVAS